jgi:ABC-type amino acid transport substrate-binding protein
MHMLKGSASRIFWLFLCFLPLLATGCISTTTTQSVQGGGKSPDILRVGVSANAPPLAYKEGNKLQGLEIDFARQLGTYLGRKIRFVELKWDNQIKALEEGRIDIIMSGLTITSKRAYRVAFAKPYMRSGQLLLVRSTEAQRFSSGIYSLMGDKPAIGTIKDTTGDFFITQTINNANITRYSTSKQAVAALVSKQIDVFVHDAPIICHYAAINESAKLTPILQLATEEFLAWAVNKTDGALLQKLNDFITAGTEDKSLQTTLKRWLPCL